MKQFLSIILSLFILTLFGCGGDDTPPTGPGDDPTSTITANTTVAEPTMSSANESVWNSVTATILDLETGGFTKNSVPKSAVATQLAIQAINKNGKLYLRINWADDDNSLSREPFIATTENGLNFTYYDGAIYGRPYAEDQLFVMFDGAPGGGWDSWNWRSLTTGKTLLAEGLTYNNGTFTADAGAQIPALRNIHPSIDNRPRYLHTNSPSFTDKVLYIGDAVDFTAISGWTIGQEFPGWVIDTSVITNLANFPQSHWDIKTVDHFSGSNYTVVLARDLNTSYSEDLDMSVLDTVQVKITVLENEINLNTNGGANQRSTATFNLVL